MTFTFIEPMLLLADTTLPDGWLYEIKLDGYRAIAGRTGNIVHLRSRNDKDFAQRYSPIARALKTLPNNTVIDGEVVALDGNGLPSFNLLQNAVSTPAGLVFYAFDVLILGGRDVMDKRLTIRRKLLEEDVMPHLSEPIRLSAELDAPLPMLIKAATQQGLEGLIAKRRESCYEPGLRSGAWRKMRFNRGQEFVIGGYTLGGKTFDALVFGYYDAEGLKYASRTRNGFTPAGREKLMKQMRPLETKQCPFVNLPEKRSGRWGQGLTADKMQECVWLKPTLVGQFEFVEWTPDNHLRHSKFIALRDDKDARNVTRER
jgi:bifunctional non-homologous end joining protein LigD